jgi:two-component sensor histidine kinase/PAS domain-containing protein
MTIAISDSLAWTRRKEKKSGLAFILICLGGVSFCLACSGEYNVDFPIQSVFWLKGEVIASTISGFALLWFIAEETQLIKPRYIVLCLIWAILASLSQVLDLGELTWVTSRPFVLHVDLPFGVDFIYKEVERGIVLVAIDFAGFFFLVYLLCIVVKFRRLGNRKESSVLFFALGFIISAEIIDFLIGIGLFRFVFLMEYAWLATILVVGLRRSNDFIEAALTRKALQKTDEDLKDSQATLSIIIDSTADLIWSVDSGSYSLLSFNRSFRNHFLECHGIAVAAGMHLDELYSSEEAIRHWREIYQRGIEEGGYSIEWSMPEDSRMFLLSINRLGRDGRVFGLSVFGQDITERKKAEKQISSSLLEKEILLREIYHRTKNNMSVIISLLRLQANEIGDDRLREAFAVSIDRILSISLVHDQLYKSGDLSYIDLGSYIKDLTDRLVAGYTLPDNRPSLVLEMDSPRVMLDAAINCGLIVNELVTNALRYAFPEGKMGEIKIRLNRDEEKRIYLTVSDNGIGPAPGFDIKRDGRLGLRLIDSLAHGKLQAQMEFNTDRGFSCALVFADEEKLGTK